MVLGKGFQPCSFNHGVPLATRLGGKKSFFSFIWKGPLLCNTVTAGFFLIQNRDLSGRI